MQGLLGAAAMASSPSYRVEPTVLNINDQVYVEDDTSDCQLKYSFCKNIKPAKVLSIDENRMNRMVVVQFADNTYQVVNEMDLYRTNGCSLSSSYRRLCVKTNNFGDYKDLM